jgi:polyphosphate kinase
MTRNLDSRVEALAPVEDPALRKELRAVLDSQLAPNRCAWQMNPDGSYQRTADSGDCQQAMIDLINQRAQDGLRLQSRARAIARRAVRKSPRG